MSAVTETGVNGPKPGVFEELRARLAAKGFTADVEVSEPPRPYKRHFDFERERDADGSPRFNDPTDCRGTLMFVDRAEPISTVRCDACGFEGGVPMRTADPEGHQRRALERAGIPPVFREREFDAHELAQQDAVKPCRVWLREFKSHAMGESLPAPALWGQPGRGKSHLLSMMIGVLITRHRTDAIYRSSSQLFEDLRDFEGSAAVKWERVLDVRVLALDDLGARKMTDWQQDRLFALIDHRMNRELPLLIATNLPPDSWPMQIGDRAASRLRGMVVPFEMGGPDRRAQTDLGIPF